MGAELVYFSPLHDKKLPKDIDGCILWGGYPEQYARELEDDGYAVVYRYGIAFCGKDCMVKLADVEN